MVARVVGIVLFLVALTAPPAYADGEDVDLQGARYAYQGPAALNAIPAATTGGLDYDYGPKCGVGGEAICFEGEPCVVDGVQGVKYNVYLQGQVVGEICVTPQQAAVGQEQVTPGLVARAFRRLDWPGSELVVQPPDGRTLVNFATNFYTEDDEAHQQSVRLLGHEVLIEAMPTGFTWRFGDGVSVRTAGPGAPYPALEVTHEYGSVGTFAPSVDVTYSGRYRVDGGGWVGIAETLTVPGAPQTLEAIEARPTLVDY